MAKPMQHLNGAILCAIDIETTGLRADQHDIIQIAILPIDGYLQLDKTRRIFAIDPMKPRRPENADEKAMRISKSDLANCLIRGMDAYKAADLFVSWWEKLGMAPGKRLQPLACNWVFERAFLIDWLGFETFDMIFDARYRDVMTNAIFANDRASWEQEPYPFPKVNLEYLCTKLQIERTARHNALDDARVTIEVFRRQVQGII